MRFGEEIFGRKVDNPFDEAIILLEERYLNHDLNKNGRNYLKVLDDYNLDSLELEEIVDFKDMMNLEHH